LAEYGYRLKKELGDDEFEKLYLKAHTEKRWTKDELRGLIEQRKVILCELEGVS
jgi:hypothetical protein